MPPYLRALELRAAWVRAARWGAPTCAMALTVAMLTLADCDNSEFPLVGGLAREAELWARSFRSRRWAASLRSSAVRLSMPAADSFTKPGGSSTTPPRQPHHHVHVRSLLVCLSVRHRDVGAIIVVVPVIAALAAPQCGGPCLVRHPWRGATAVITGAKVVESKAVLALFCVAGLDCVCVPAWRLGRGRVGVPATALGPSYSAVRLHRATQEPERALTTSD